MNTVNELAGLPVQPKEYVSVSTKLNEQDQIALGIVRNELIGQLGSSQTINSSMVLRYCLHHIAIEISKAAVAKLTSGKGKEVS